MNYEQLPGKRLPIFERTVPDEYAIVLQGGKRSLKDPRQRERVKEILEKMGGFSMTTLLTLLSLNLKTSDAKAYEYFQGGVKIEDIVSREIPVPRFGLVVVGDVRLHQAAAPLNVMPMISFQRKENDRRSFEILYVHNGEARMVFPDAIEPVGQVYKQSAMRSEVTLRRGDMVFIPAGVANGWSSVGPNFSFRSISVPPWREDRQVHAY